MTFCPIKRTIDMVFFKLIFSDLKNGIFKNYRYLYFVIIAFLNFSVARILLIKNNDFDISIIDILDKALSIYYFPMTILFFAVFICLDFTHKSFTSSCVQILYRTKNRAAFYLAKCVFCIFSALFTWVVFLLTSVLFCALYRYSFEIPQHATSGFLSLDRDDLLIFMLSPIAVLISLNILQMLICMLIKPMFAYLATVIFIMVGAMCNSPWLFAHSGINFYYDIKKSGYDTKKALTVCLLTALISAIIGMICFKKYDILPDKEDN